jgi:hypothetical protein
MATADYTALHRLKGALIPPGSPLDSENGAPYTAGDFNNCSQYQGINY